MEPMEVLDVYPLMIRCGDFYVGGDCGAVIMRDSLLHG